ncbi:hypothetical protein J8273_4221 [Carpediemonas membranifera]|uniref:Uncharacterized protein n=1 Tax=Carpediemonas membranifera TaxID=201153 RepID=A0A8J6AYG6_9EUKA|nr:hypothetical protein J8273_4221 [Carpediemonas membranifera]|eukprot:KAG9394545.1 hypothetical protein J8273_4221 [Carpediemonas membranifera]
MVNITVDVPSLDPKKITLPAIRDFKRAARIWVAQNADFPPGVLLPESLQRAAEEFNQGKSIEELSLEQTITYLRSEAIPKSLGALKDAVDAIDSAMRNYCADFSEYTDLVKEVACRETALNHALSPLQRRKEQERPASDSELAALRAEHFDKVLCKAFMYRLKPKVFYKKLELERTLIKPKNINELMKLAKIVASVEDENTPTTDSPDSAPTSSTINKTTTVGSRPPGETSSRPPRSPFDPAASAKGSITTTTALNVDPARTDASALPLKSSRDSLSKPTPPRKKRSS